MRSLERDEHRNGKHHPGKWNRKGLRKLGARNQVAGGLREKKEGAIFSPKNKGKESNKTFHDGKVKKP